MSLVFTDGFDYYSSLALKWTTANGTIGTSSVRSGTNGVQVTGNLLAKQVKVSQEHATFIVGCALKRGTNGTFEIRFYSDSLATQHVTVQVTANGEIKVFRGSIAGTQLGSTTSPNLVPSGTFVYLEAKCTLNDTTGVVTVKINGTQVFTITSADTKNAGTKTVLDGFGFIITTANADVDDIYLCNGAGSTNNDFLGDIKIETLFPTGAGNTTQLTPSTGSNWQNVDDTTPNTTDYNSSATDNQYDTYQMGDLVTASGTVFGVVAHAYAAKSDAGTKGGAIVIRSGGTDYEQTDNALGTGYQYYDEILEVNPNTGVAWTVTNVNSVEAGFKVKAS